MSTSWTLAIDFGTSFSAAAVWAGGDSNDPSEKQRLAEERREEERNFGRSRSAVPRS